MTENRVPTQGRAPQGTVGLADPQLGGAVLHSGGDGGGTHGQEHPHTPSGQPNTSPDMTRCPVPKEQRPLRAQSEGLARPQAQMGS